MQDATEESVATKKKSDARSFENLLSSETATRVVYLAIGAVIITLVFRHLQFATGSICCGDFDGYYHIKWSQLLWQGMRSGNFPPAFNWLPLTTLDPAGYVDHHLLFHILQIPFTWFGNLTMGAKVAAIIFGSLAVFSCYWLVVHYRIKYPLVWLLALLACSGPFLYRLNMAKAPPIAIIFMVAGIYLLFEKRYWMLGPLMFLFVWTYSLFPSLWFAALVWTLVIAWSERRFEWRPLVWTTAGMIAGLIINPYFPKNIRLFIEHARIKLTLGDFSTQVGQEWYPYDSWVFLGNCFIACIAMLVGYIAFNGSDHKRSSRSLFFLIFSTALMFATFRSRRFVEYWPPFAVLFAAFSLQQVWDSVRGAIGELPADVLDELQPFLDRQQEAETGKVEAQRELWKTVAAGGVATALFITMLFNIKGVAKLKLDGVAGEIASGAGPEQYHKGMDWIRTNVPAGQRIFNTDWDDFPKMFFYDTTHAYISGLDPTYLLNKNPELSKLYDEVTLGRVDDPAAVIRDRFGARYVFSDQEEIHDDFYGKAMASGWFEKVYEDDECVVLHIRDQQGEPPQESLEDNAPGPEPQDEGGLSPEEDAEP